MKKIISRWLIKLGLLIIPKNVGDDLVVSWGIIHKGKYFGFLFRYGKKDLEAINDAVSHLSSHVDVILKDLKIIPRPDGWLQINSIPWE